MACKYRSEYKLASYVSKLLADRICFECHIMVVVICFSSSSCNNAWNMQYIKHLSPPRKFKYLSVSNCIMASRVALLKLLKEIPIDIDKVALKRYGVLRF